jgi:dipeptidase D
MSKEAIEGLKPEILWQRFYEISQIPRPSKKEEKILEYLRNFAKEHNIKMLEDDTHNIVMKVPATNGYENAPTVIIQGHVDMVCEKNKGTKHDFDNDPIKLIRDGEWMRADGTTLGADNGIGVAAGLAMITDDSVVHGPLELLFTVDEETGLTGANNLATDMLEGKTLLNCDSEEDGAFYVGCSGGQDTVGIYDIEWKELKKDLVPYELTITGLKGGHSGLDIANGRANAIKLLARLMLQLTDVDYRIAEINGGSKRNAIPREAETILLITESDAAKIKQAADEFVKEALLEYKVNDGGLKVELNKKDGSYNKVFKRKFAKRILHVLNALPHGIMAMSPDIPDLVETSTNLATVFTEGDKIRIGTSQRSSIETAKLNISNVVKSIFALSGVEEILDADSYPGWQPNLDSPVLKLGKEVFKEKYGKDPEIKAIHAGLECGILADKYPGLDMVSFGPTIQGAHSPDEKVNIKDVEKFYTLLTGILEKIAKG